MVASSALREQDDSVLPLEPDDLSSSPGTHEEEGENLHHYHPTKEIIKMWFQTFLNKQTERDTYHRVG